MVESNVINWSTVVGAIIGALASITTTVVNDWLRNRRTSKLDRARKDVLLRLLSGPKYTWRSMAALSSAIGADEETTARLLLEIGARRSLDPTRNNWGLKEWPDDLKDDDGD